MITAKARAICSPEGRFKEATIERRDAGPKGDARLQGLGLTAFKKRICYRQLGPLVDTKTKLLL